MDDRKMKLETTSIFSCSLFFLRRVFLFLLLPCTPVLAVEVELQLVVHDAPDVSVDKRAHTRWIHDAVATSSGTQVQIVGLDQNVWPRNIILDDDAKKPDQSKLIFERFYKGKYIGRHPVARKELAAGEHTIWPGEHRFTIDEQGKIKTNDPELIIAGNVIKIKAYPVTVRAYFPSADWGGKLSGLPNITVREANHALALDATADGDGKVVGKHRELLVEIKPPGDHGEVPFPFAPLTLWLPAHSAGKGYLLHPIGLTFHVNADGVVPSAGGGKRLGAIRTDGHVIEIPKYRFPAVGAAGAQAVIAYQSLKWHEKNAGAIQYFSLNPRQEPYDFRVAEYGPTIRLDGGLTDLPAKNMSVDFADPRIGTQRGMVVEMPSRHFTSGKQSTVRIRAIEATAAKLVRDELAIIESEQKAAERKLEISQEKLSLVDAEFRKAETELAKRQKANPIDEAAVAEQQVILAAERKKIAPQLTEFERASVLLKGVQARVEEKTNQIDGVNAVNPLADAKRFGRIQSFDGGGWTELNLTAKSRSAAEFSFTVPPVSPGIYKLRFGVRSSTPDSLPLLADQWITITGSDSIGVGLFTQRGRDAYFRGESFWIAAAVDINPTRQRGRSDKGQARIAVGTKFEFTITDSSGRTIPLLSQATKKAVTRNTFIIRLDAATSRKLAPGRYTAVARIGKYDSRPLEFEIVEPDPKTHFANVLIGKYNTLSPDYSKVLTTGKGADRLARAIRTAGYNSFKGMTYSMHRIHRSESAIEALVRERPQLGPWESYYQPSNRDRFLNACVKQNLKFWENMFTHHDQMLPRGEKFTALCERFTSLEVASMRHSPVFEGVCLYDEFTHSLDHDTPGIIVDYFRQQEEVNYRRRHPGMSSDRAMRGLDRFLARPPGSRNDKDLALFRTRAEHEDWEWSNFSARTARGAKEVMQSSRNFTLQRYGGGNGNRMGDHGYTATMFRDLDIAATVMYKDGGYGDRPIYAPILADVLRTRTKNTRRGPPQTARSVHRPLDVWTQVHTHSGPALFQRHVMRQVFFALSQKVEGITYFECQTRPQEPTYIDHADTLRDCTARFCEPYGDLLRACDKGYKRVAIYYSRKADHLGLHKAAKAPFQCEGLWAACMRAGFPADFLYDEQILAGEGHDYDVIFTPNFTIADEVPGNILKSLRSLADDGKLLVAERGSKLPIEGLRRLDSDFGEFDDGMRNAWPKYIDSTFDEVFELSEKTTALVGDFLKQHIPPAAEHGMVLGPDWLRSRSGKYLVVSNFAPTNFTGLHKTLYQAPDTPTLSFPKAGEVCYDMLEMKRMKVIASRRGVKAPPGSEATTLWQTLEADLRHYPGKIYAFLPAAIDRVHLEAPPTVSTGADLNYRVAVRDAQGKPIDAGFPLEVQLRTPRGDLIYEVFRAATPQYRGAYTIPVNTEPGIWRLRVRELISGAWSEATINVTAGDLPLAKLDEREVWLRDETRIAEFLGRSTKSDDKEINIVVDDRQMPHIAPLAERLRSGLKRHGIRAKIVNYNDVFVIPIGEMLAGGMANVDGRRDWRGGLIAPSIFVEAPVILIGKRYENSLIEAIITADVLAEPLTDNFPGAGRGLVGWARRAFSNYFDTVCVLASDDGGLHRGIDALLEIAASEGRFANPSRDAVHPNIQLGTPDADAKLAPANKTDRTPSSYREAISNEDLVVSLDVDPATGRTLVGTFGYGQNLFCFSADGELLWKTFLPEHNVYFARWYDGGKKVVAATGRGYYAFLIEAATGRVFKKFSATEWPTFHGGEGAVTTKVGFNFNPKLRQILVRGRTGLLAVTYEGERMWFHDRLPVIAEYCQEAEQTAAASFIQNCRIKNVAISPDGGRLAYSEIRVIGSAIGFGGYYTVWGHRPQVIDARSGEVLASFFDDRGSSGNPDVRVSWPADSNLPFAHIGPFQAVMQLDGKIGEYKLDSGLGRKNSPVTVLDEKPPSGLQLLPNYTRMLSADGETVWENYAAEPWLVPEKSLSWGVGDDRLQSYPSSADGKRIYRVNPFGEIRAISLADGRTLWEANVRFSAKLFPIDGELIAATNNGMIVRLDAAGKLRWKKRLRDLYSKPVGDYRSYILAANLRDAEAAIRVFDTGTDRPGEYDGVLRMGIEQLADGGFENTKSVPRLEGERPDDSPPGAGVGVWYTAGGSVEIVAVGRSGNRGLQLGASQSAGQQVARKVIPSATYLLEFWFKTDSPGVNLAAGCELVSGGGPGVTASVFRGRPGQWAFGRLAVKSMSDTQAISVLFEAEGGVVLVDDVSLRAVRFPSANLLADPELHEVEPTFVDDVRVKYDKLPTGLREKLMEQNHVAAYRQGGTSSRTIYLQEQAFLHNGRQDDLGRRWIGLADPIGFSAVLQEPAWISHVVLYLNNATPDNAYEFIGILANDFALQPPVPKTVGIVRGNRRQFIVVHLPEPVFTDSIKILPGKHPALSDCLTEVELYGPLGGPDVGGRGFPNDADGVPMFMGGPAHVRKNLPPDMVGNYRQVFLQHHNAAFHSSGTIFHDRYNIGDPSGLVRDGEGRVSNWGGLKPLVRNDSGQFRWDKTRLLQTVGLTSTPAHYSGRMLVGAADHKLHAVADNGAYLWGFKTGGRVYSSPVPNGDDVYFGSDDGRLYKVDIDSGILIWEFATGGKIRSAPVLSFADNLAARVFFASYDGHVYSVDARSGSLVWKAPIGPFSRTSPALANGRIYIGDEQGTAHALDAANGRGVWSVKLDGYISRCPVVTADGVTFVTDQGTAALVGHDGRVRWQRNLGSRLSGQSAATQTQIIVPTESALHVLRRQDGLADGRFVPPSPLGNLVDITVYKDRLYFVQRRVNIVEYGNRTFAEFRSQVGVWQAPEIATKK